MQTFVLAVSSAIVISFLCSIFESVLLSINRAQIAALEARGSRAGRLMRRFKERIDVPIAAILTVNTIAHTIGASVAGASYAEVFDPQSLWVFSIVFTAAVLIFTEIVPKTLGVTHSMRLAPASAYGIEILIIVLRPVVAVTEKLSSLLRGKSSAPVTSVEEIRLLATLGRQEGAVGTRTAGIILGATRLSDLRADDIMTPRHQIAFIAGDWPTDKVLARLRDSRHSRFPFTPGGPIDQFTGIVLAKDLLLHLEAADGDVIDWKAIVREPLVVPKSQPLNRLLRSFQETRMHMAMVVDEYGQFLGVATIEDVLEEIVGEIFDESDETPADFERLSDGGIAVRADMDLRRLAAILEISREPDETANSINGVLSERLGRLPASGDQVEWRGHAIQVVAASARRAERVIVRRISP